jgi:hypothetical protein
VPKKFNALSIFKNIITAIWRTWGKQKRKFLKIVGPRVKTSIYGILSLFCSPTKIYWHANVGKILLYSLTPDPLAIFRNQIQKEPAICDTNPPSANNSTMMYDLSWKFVNCAADRSCVKLIVLYTLKNRHSTAFWPNSMQFTPSYRISLWTTKPDTIKVY